MQWWTAIGTVVAGLIAVPALLVSLTALRISEEQRVDAQRQFAQRVTLPDNLFDQVIESNQLTISNANTIPVAVEMIPGLPRQPVAVEMIPGLPRQPVSVIYTTNIPACTEVSHDFPRGQPVVISKRAEGLNRFVVFNPLDGNWWGLRPPGGQVAVVDKDDWWHPNSDDVRREDLSATKSKTLSGCV